jgi:hypothetical protein
MEEIGQSSNNAGRAMLISERCGLMLRASHFSLINLESISGRKNIMNFQSMAGLVLWALTV